MDYFLIAWLLNPTYMGLNYNAICLPTKILNTSGFKWNKDDDIVLARAKYVCGTDSRYSDTPCLGMLHKKRKTRLCSNLYL